MLRLWIGRTLAVVGMLSLAACGSTSAPPSRPAETVGVARIALVRDPLNLADLWVSDIDGAQSRLLASHVSGPVCASADRLVYTTVDQAGLARLQQLDLTTAVSATLVSDAEAAFAQPTCNREQVVYVRRSYELVDDEPSQAVVWRTPIERPAASVLHGDSESGALNPRWSPDGSALAFEILNEEILAIMQADGVLRRLEVNGTFDWSPDSRKLLVATLPGPAGPSQLITIDRTTGTTATLLTAPAADLYDPRWSPDGATIAFVQRTYASGRGEIMQMPASADAGAQPLTSDLAYDNFDPQWSPDSTALLWTRKDAAETRYAVWTLQLPAAAPRLVADNAWWGRWVP
ncbi:MAG: PD40 domain-containing protein [Herpetosiphonaceae bacterium]|nr:PD40 domain-containing protein [Herpetosiphonaceae bacterium]